MTTETELRHMAAKACGILVDERGPFTEVPCMQSEFGNGNWIENVRRDWNPHTDDGDSARMRSALGISVNFVCSPTSNRISGVRCFADRIGHYMQMHEHVEHVADHNNDRNAALRLCALRVAAAIGEGMK